MPEKMSGSAKIPVGDMAMQILDKMFPHLNAAQLDSLRNKTPMPPSPDWLARGTGQVQVLPHPTVMLEELPTVTCILAFGLRERIKMARRSVNQFVRQTYPRKRLIIVNATDTPVTNVPHHEIEEVRISHGKTEVDVLRNVGLERTTSEWVMPGWDDDDIYDPHLLVYLMLYRQTAKATMLARQVRTSIRENIAYMHHDPKGVPGTMIVPNDMRRFTPGPQSVQRFAEEHYPNSRVVIDNARAPLTTLSIAVHHGNNSTTLESFMPGHAGPAHKGVCSLESEEYTRLAQVMKEFGLVVSVK